MAIDSNAITIADFMLQADQPPIVNAVGNSLLDNGSILARDIPMVNANVLVANGVRWTGNLPTVNWAKINEEGVTVKGTPTPYGELAYLLRNYVDIDEVLLRTAGQLVDPRASQLEAVLRAIAYDFNFKFIKNDHSASGDADAPVGLRARLDDPATWGIPTANKLNINSQLTPGTATAADVNGFLEKLDELLWMVDSPEGEGVTLYMNEIMMRRMHFALRLMGTTGGLNQSRDQFDRVITQYKGATLRDAGYKADQSTRIIGYESATGVDGSGANDDFTSIYAVNFGTSHLFGWQYGPVELRPVSPQDNGVINRTLVQWVGGIYQQHIRSIARGYNIRLQA